MKKEHFLLFEKYYFNKLSNSQKIDFEKKLSEDNDFSHDYAFYKQTHEAINLINQNRLRELMKKEKKSNIKYAKIIKMNRIKASLRIAASIIFILGVWQPTKDSSTLLFNEFSSKEISLAENIFYNYESTSNSLRGKSNILKGLSDIETEKINQSIQLYLNENYASSAEILNSIDLSNSENPVVILNRGIINLKAFKLEQALIDFKSLKESDLDRKLICSLDYNLALTLLGQGNKKEAKMLLTNVSNEECVEAEKAKDILSRIRIGPDFF